MVYKVRRIDTEGVFETRQGQGLVDSSLDGDSVLPHGCCNGQCGNCAVQVFSGESGYLNDYKPSGLLTPKQQKQGWVISCMAEAKSDLVLNVPQSARKPPLSACADGTVIEKMLLAGNILRLTLKVSGDKAFYFLPGQYIDILQGEEGKRSYSISSLSNADSLIELHIRYVENGHFSEHAFNKLEAGDVLALEGPKGYFFWRSERSNPVIMVAGGTGFAPIKGIINEILESDPQKVIHLYWGGSTPSDFYAEQDIQQWLSVSSTLKYTPVLFNETEGWSGRTGSAIEAVVTDYPVLSAYDVYIAGPPVMVKQGIDVFPAFDLPKENLFTDAFEYAHSAKRKVNIMGKIGGLFSRKRTSRNADSCTE